MNHSILSHIGNTPLIEIRRLNPNPNVRILAKIEYVNPGGSIKDRPALFMIEEGERSGELTREKTVIEATSGNTGIGLAMVCAIKGYRLTLAMSESASIERQKILRARGSEILLTPGHMGTDGAIEEVYRLAREYPDKYFLTDQFNNPANWQAHYYGTGEEIWRQTNGQVTSVVATMGTTGTLMGIQRRLKEYDSRVRIIGVEPYLGHKIQGLKNMKESYCPEIYEKDRLDEKINVEDEEAFEMTRQLSREEGLFVGMSSGAAMVAARAEAASLGSGMVVVIFPDSGERYLSTPLFEIQESAPIRFFNTLGRKKAVFHPISPGKVGVYSCGPTAHHRMRVGECRRMVFSDLLVRYLTYRGFDVTHVMNITDMDDRTIEGSEKAGMPLKTFTDGYIASFHEDLETLGVQPATRYPRASENVDEMVRLTDSLINKGFAYEKLRSIYFNIGRVGGYGDLSGIDLGKIRLGHTVDLDAYEKDNPRDFTLMKRCRLSELKRGIYTKTQWGNVRPSWHVQCAAMSMKYLGVPFDIHTSGRELVFPHHENEMAIARAATGKPLARYWLHCAPVLVEGKETDSQDMGITLVELLEKGWSGRVVRYWLLSGNYRKPIAYSDERLKEAQQALSRIDHCLEALSGIPEGESTDDIDQMVYDLKTGFIGAMDDDLNVSEAFAAIFQVVRKVNSLITEGRIQRLGAQKLLQVFLQLNMVLNVFQPENKSGNSEISQLSAQREEARGKRDFARADELRGRLLSLGVTVRDGKSNG